MLSPSNAAVPNAVFRDVRLARDASNHRYFQNDCHVRVDALKHERPYFQVRATECIVFQIISIRRNFHEYRPTVV